MFVRSAARLFRASTALKESEPASPSPSTSDDIQPVQSLPTRPWPFLWHFVRERFLRRYATMAGLVIVAQAMETLEPYVLKLLVNSLVGAKADPDAATRALLIFTVMVAMWFVAAMLYRGYQMLDIGAAPYFRERVQNQMFGYLLGHAPRYFQDNFAGKLGQKIKEAGRCCLGILELITFDVVRIASMLTVAFALLITHDLLLAAVLAAWALIYGSVSGVLAYRCVSLSKGFSEAVSTSAGKLIDSIANADTVRSFANWRHERVLLAGYFGDERQRSVRLRTFLIVMRIFQASAVLSMIAVMVYLALQSTLVGTMDIGSFTLVFTLTNIIGLNVWTLSNRMLDFFEAIGTLTESIDIITGTHDIADRPGAMPLQVQGGAIAFEGIDYSHPNGTPLFRGLDLKIQAGERVALVGPSGAGKSTLVKLLRRQFEPSTGRVLIDGQDIQQVTWDSVNQAIAEVSQTPGIFHRPIQENIRYGQLGAGAAEVVAAAKQAHCHEFIATRPQGYATVVGEQGIKLSGGERQRVAIARALLKDAPILVLDEATSSLDSESEYWIQEALFEVMRGRTVIAIAHRLSTIKSMDRIVYLDGGRIVEEGTHAELLARGGGYAGLWNRQVGGFIPEEGATPE